MLGAEGGSQPWTTLSAKRSALWYGGGSTIIGVGWLPSCVTDESAVSSLVGVIKLWDFHGKTCPYCQSPIKEGTSLIVCPHCEMPHHYECWRENGGCTTFGCGQQAAAEGVQHVPVATALDQSYYEQRPSSQYQLEATLLAGQYRPAGFCARFGAYLIDMILCIIVAAIIGDDSGLLVTTLYFGILQGQTGHTLGKSMLGLKVIRTNGEPISIGRGIGRHFATIMSGMIFGIGFLMAAWTQNKQALHDIIADTVVVTSR